MIHPDYLKSIISLNIIYKFGPEIKKIYQDPFKINLIFKCNL